MKFSHAVLGAGLLGTAVADIDPIIIKVFLLHPIEESLEE